MRLDSPSQRGDFVSASELAQLGYCERKIAFDVEFGPVRTLEQRIAQERGLREHAAFYDEGLAAGPKGRCFLATLVLGDCAETRALRAFRDHYLRSCRVGRWFIVSYYHASPPLCRWLQARPVALRLIRPLLKLVAWLARAAVGRRMRAGRSTRQG